MSAPALAGRPSVRIRGTHYPVLLPTVRDPRLHLAGVIVSLQVLGQVAFDFQLSIAQILVSLLTAAVLEVAITFRGQRVLMWPASALLTGNGVAFVLRVPGHRARRLVEHERRLDLRGDVRSRLALEVPDPGSTAARLQPVELRPCAVLPAARRRACGSAGAVVGAVVPGPRPRDRVDRRRRLPDPPAAPPRRSRRRLLARVRRRHRRARGQRAHDDGRLARGTDRGSGVLVAAGLLARDPRVPLLHDHRPEDDPGRAARAPRVRGGSRAAGDVADRTVHDRVRDEGGDPGGAVRRVRDTRSARATRLGAALGAPRPAARAEGDRDGRARGSARLCRPRRRGRNPGPARRGACTGRGRRRRGTPGGQGGRVGGRRADRRHHRPKHRARCRRRSPHRGRSPREPGPGASGRRCSR